MTVRDVVTDLFRILSDSRKGTDPYGQGCQF